MKLNKEFILHVSDDETILVPVGSAGFSGIVRGNSTLGKILELLKEDTSVEKIISDISSMYEGPADVIEADVKNAIDKLREIGALDE